MDVSVCLPYDNLAGDPEESNPSLTIVLALLVRGVKPFPTLAVGQIIGFRQQRPRTIAVRASQAYSTYINETGVSRHV